MSDEISVHRNPLKPENKMGVLRPLEFEAYGGKVEIIWNNTFAKITFATLANPLVVSIPIKTFGELLRKCDKALMEKGLGGRSIGKRR